MADVAAAAKFVEDNEIAVLGFFADAEGNIFNFEFPVPLKWRKF